VRPGGSTLEAVDLTEDRPAVRLELDSTAETLTLVRGALGAVAELLSLDPELLDDLKTAVSEACNNVVLHAYDGAPGPLGVLLYVNPGEIEVVVRDEGSGIPVGASTDDRMQGVGLPIIRALAERAEFRHRSGGGTEVRMMFVGHRDGKPLFEPPAPAAAEDGWTDRLSGEAVVSLSPVSFVGAVLGRLARALAARARFSLDRFSDVYLVTDAIASHAARAAHGERIGFGLSTGTRRLELTLGPFRPGSGSQLKQERPVRDVGSPLLLLSDEVEIRPADGEEVLHVVMTDRPREPVHGPA
jgi:anti-sigma regulatory factor (Ser/Thr protein kinase)